MSTPLILFDLDGTLADTAPGLAAAANMQRERRGLAPMAYEQLRPMASHGARGLLRVALGMEPDHPEFLPTRDQLLSDYAELMYELSWLFPGVPELLDRISNAGLRWGIVTNKMTNLAEPLVRHMDLPTAVLVCGDTTPHPKPHPAPLLHAAALLQHPPTECIYVGDDLRDIMAGKAAGMRTVAAAWGYCGDGEPVTQWQADLIAEAPPDTWSAVDLIRGVFK